MTLSVEDYMKTVKDTRFPKRSEMREFGKVYNGTEDVYIKIKSRIVGAVWKYNNVCNVISFCRKSVYSRDVPI